MNLKYKRIVLKLSGEALKDVKKGDCLDSNILKNLAVELKAVHEMGVQVCLVVGGGNIFRGQLPFYRDEQKSIHHSIALLKDNQLP